MARLNNGGATLTDNVSDAATETGKPVSVNALVVLTLVLPAPAAPTVTVIENVQLSPALSAPPVRAIVDAPDTLDPAPQAPAPGTPLNVAPEIAPPKSSVNCRLVRFAPPTGLSMV